MDWDPIQQYQDPAYTGEMRCLPCTVVNSVIAVLLSGGVFAAGSATLGSTIGGVAAAGVLLLSAASIYFKGYLVPGTPALTKRYFPDWLLSAFGKDPSPTVGEPATTNQEAAASSEQEVQPPSGEKEDLDLEEFLVDAGALEPCQGGADLCLTDAFRRDWERQIERVNESDVGRDRLPAILNISAGEVSVEDHGTAFRARVDGRYVGTWESQAAFVADIAAADVLAEWVEDWDEVSIDHRGQLLNGLRLFLKTCPECGGALAFGTDTVESCCSTHEVAAVSCEACETRVFESKAVA